MQHFTYIVARLNGEIQNGFFLDDYNHLYPVKFNDEHEIPNMEGYYYVDDLPGIGTLSSRDGQSIYSWLDEMNDIYDCILHIDYA